jgi:signal transduction histidine kinase
MVSTIECAVVNPTWHLCRGGVPRPRYSRAPRMWDVIRERPCENGATTICPERTSVRESLPVAPPVLLRPPRWVVDAAVSLFIVAAGVVQTTIGGAVPADGVVVLLTAAALVATLLRHRFPRGVAAVAIALCALGLVAGFVPSTVVALLVCLYGVAQRTARRTSLWIALAAVVVLWLTSFFFYGDRGDEARTFFQILTFVGFASAAGDASRNRREYIAAITERARIAEETRETEARRRVAEERLRIARDLHDVLAHQIAVINLHSNVAAQALRERPEDAERSLATVRQAARTVLGEIGSLLSVLRSPDADSDTVPRGVDAPVATLAQLDELLDAFARSGLRVDVRRDGRSEPVVPEQVGVVVYRVIQEALTNAHKHGADDSALLYLDYGVDTLEVTVTNTVDTRTSRTPSPEAEGHGLTGVRERLASVNGVLDTSVGPGPVFRFTARIPNTAPIQEGHK